MLPWFAASDRINYNRWGLIFLTDMQQLEETGPVVYEGFKKGDFVADSIDEIAMKKIWYIFSQVIKFYLCEKFCDISHRLKIDRPVLEFN